MELRTVLEPRGPAAAIVLTDAQVAELSSAKAFPVQVTVGGVTVRARLARMGGENLIGFSKALRGELGVEVGATVDARIALDEAPREVEVPAALAAALTNAKVRKAFDAQSFTVRKEQARTVAEAKKDETRDNRIAKIVAALQA